MCEWGDMPKGFSEREKAIIRASLREKGRELFSDYGLRKTSVEDLTRAAGISKGAFYLFYDSKEELFFELLEQFEASYKASLLQTIAESTLPPRERMRTLLHNAVAVLKDNPLFAHFSREEYEYLSRKLPEERLRAHLQSDESFAVEFIAAWQAAGIAIGCEPEMVTGLIRSLFFIAMHEDDIGAGVYPRVIDVYVDLLARYFVQEGFAKA
jgi:AcrR family transcriptional regulator